MKIVKKLKLSGLCILLALNTSIVSAGPLGSPYTPHTHTIGKQFGSMIAMGASGDHAILYKDADRSSVFARQYFSSGAALYTSELPLNVPGVIASSKDGNGNFATLRKVNDGSSNGVFVTVYNSAGSVIVNQFRVNAAVTGNQGAADIDMNRNGDFVVTWTDFLSAGGYDVYVKRYQLNGTPTTGEIKVNNTLSPTTFQPAMSVAISETGEFAVNYLTGYQSTTNSSDVWVRKFDQYGVAQTNPLRVNTTISGPQDGSDIAMDAYGNFIVVWESYSDGDNRGVYAQRYNAAGAKQGGEFRVNSAIAGNQTMPAVDMSADGDFVIAWSSYDSINSNIYAREYTSNGIARGIEFLVNDSTSTKNIWPDVGLDACGSYTVVWDGLNVNSDNDVFARRYASTNPSAAPCLANGKTAANLSGATASWKYFKISVPAGKSLIDIQQWGGFGDADLFVRLGALPTHTAYNGVSYNDGNTERLTYSNPPAGDWYFGVYGYSSFSGLNINVQHY